MEQNPSVGRIVHFFPTELDDEARSNGNSGPVAAVITRVWDESMVNLTIFPDAMHPTPRTSVPHRSTHAPGAPYWDWPERV